MKDNADKPVHLSCATVILNVPVRPENQRRADKKTTRLCAQAVKRIHDRQSGELVGWLYEWNTGELVPRWKTEARSDVIYV